MIIDKNDLWARRDYEAVTGLLIKRKSILGKCNWERERERERERGGWTVASNKIQVTLLTAEERSLKLYALW